MFRLGEDSPSEISLGRGIKNKEETNIVNTKISEYTEGSNKATLFQILFLEGGERGICGGSVDGGAILCMSLVEECNIVSNYRSRGTGDYIPRGNKRVCVVMAPSSPHLPSSAFFHPVLIGSTLSNVKRFEGLLLLSYTLGRWGEIFQVLEEEAQNYQ